MKTTCDDAIRVRAYHLWERAGRPEGRADDFWIAAQREVGADNAENATVDEALEETFPASDPAASTYRTTSG